MQTIYQYMKDDGRFKSIISAINKVKLSDLLQSDGTFTVFAPTDAECELDLQQRGTTCKAVLKDIPLLTKMVGCHIVHGEYKTRKLATTLVLNPLNGNSLMVEYDKGIILNGRIKILEKNIPCDNGVIHIIDGMLIPKGALNCK